MGVCLFNLYLDRGEPLAASTRSDANGIGCERGSEGKAGRGRNHLPAVKLRMAGAAGFQV